MNETNFIIYSDRDPKKEYSFKYIGDALTAAVKQSFYEDDTYFIIDNTDGCALELPICATNGKIVSDCDLEN